jgi:hypothetical protein
MEAYGARMDKPMKPQVVAWHLGKLPEDGIISCDSGTIATWWRHTPAKRGQLHSLSGNLATMAPGLSYAIAIEDPADCGSIVEQALNTRRAPFWFKLWSIRTSRPCLRRFP